MTKILFLIPSLAKGGAERLVLDICNEFQKRSEFKVKLITFHPKNEYQFLTKELDYSVVPSLYTPSLKGKSSVDIKCLQEEINKFQPNIIHSHLFETEMILSAIKYTNCKYFVHFHDNMKQFTKLRLNTLKSKEALTNYYERKIVLKSYKTKNVSFIAIAKDSQKFILKNLSKRYKNNLLHNAIDTNRFSKTVNEKHLDRLVIIGSLVDKKGQELAIEIINELHKRNQFVYLDILGEGPNRQKLIELIKRYNLENFICLYGNVDHPEEFLAKSTIYLHTAKYEPFGLVLIEAMASGLPVVCTNAKGNVDLIENGVNGYLVEERDAILIANKIEILLKDSSQRELISKNAKKYSSNYDIKNYVDRLIMLYQN
jgi:glycosyltransferase involved in cell wall biosynthesis